MTWSKEVVTKWVEMTASGLEKYPQNVHLYLVALCTPPLPCPQSCCGSPAQHPRGRRRGIRGYDFTLSPAGRTPPRQGAPARRGGGQWASSPTRVYPRFAGHSREPTGCLLPLLGSEIHSGAVTCLQKTAQERTSGLALGRWGSMGSPGPKSRRGQGVAGEASC